MNALKKFVLVLLAVVLVVKDLLALVKGGRDELVAVVDLSEGRERFHKKLKKKWKDGRKEGK